MSPEERADEKALHEAIGWLLGSLERDHPAYLAEQAGRVEGVEGFEGAAVVLRQWADRHRGAT